VGEAQHRHDGLGFTRDTHALTWRCQPDTVSSLPAASAAALEPLLPLREPACATAAAASAAAAAASAAAPRLPDCRRPAPVMLPAGRAMRGVRMYVYTWMRLGCDLRADWGAGRLGAVKPRQLSAAEEAQPSGPRHACELHQHTRASCLGLTWCC
jgi:hypothetical protein